MNSGFLSEFALKLKVARIGSALVSLALSFLEVEETEKKRKALQVEERKWEWLSELLPRITHALWFFFFLLKVLLFFFEGEAYIRWRPAAGALGNYEFDRRPLQQRRLVSADSGKAAETRERRRAAVD